MNIEAVKQKLTEDYPGVNIKETTITDGVVTEIVGEIDRKLVGSDRDVAVVVADRSAEHHHKIITEEYEIIKGALRVYKNGQPVDLKTGETVVIEPGTKHWVEGDETWFYCYSVPDWFPGDLYLTEPPH
ncbi:MAG TPA: cupin domain-containing protein [Candidatus Saccharimonadales bacterium]|nr:cupin domain-containing protein [Candidatus Saccharimonadales bacterium]